MEFDALQNTPGFCRVKGLIQSRGNKGIEVIQYQPDFKRLRKIDNHQRTHLLSEITFGATSDDGDVPPTLTRTKADEQVATAFTAVLVVIALALSRSSRLDAACVTDQLVWTLVKAHHWIQRVCCFRDLPFCRCQQDLCAFDLPHRQFALSQQPFQLLFWQQFNPFTSLIPPGYLLAS